MTTKGMNEYCVCSKQTGESGDDSHLILLSSIPNQKIYRCSKCQAFLSYTSDLQLWEVLIPGDLEEEIKGLYQYSPSAAGTA